MDKPKEKQTCSFSVKAQLGSPLLQFLFSTHIASFLFCAFHRHKRPVNHGAPPHALTAELIGYNAHSQRFMAPTLFKKP